MSTKEYDIEQIEADAKALYFSYGEVGTATFWAMLFCIVAITSYVKVGKEYLDSTVPDTYHMLIVMTLAIITLFTTGCAIHMIFVGDKSSRQLRRDLFKQNDELARFVINAKKRVRDFEADALRQAGIVRPQCLDSIGTVRRLVNALGLRGDDIRKLLSSRSKFDLIDAHELLRKPLIITENCMDSLIGADPVPPIDPEEWLGTVDRLFNQIETDLGRITKAA